MSNLIRAWYEKTPDGRVYRAHLRHVDNGFGRPMCKWGTGLEEQGGPRVRKWMQEVGYPTCPKCRQILAKAEAKVG